MCDIGWHLVTFGDIWWYLGYLLTFFIEKCSYPPNCILIGWKLCIVRIKKKVNFRIYLIKTGGGINIKFWPKSKSIRVLLELVVLNRMFELFWNIWFFKPLLMFLSDSKACISLHRPLAKLELFLATF